MASSVIHDSKPGLTVNGDPSAQTGGRSRAVVDRVTASGVGQQIVEVPISSLVPADSPRLDGVMEQHARGLAEVEAVLPPIVVHRPYMRVIDGMHRVRAAQLRGEKTIRARFFDGTEDAAFVLGVEANIAHGLPLSLSDREAAAARIIRLHPEWSDRAIGLATGLAAKTVGSMRRSATGELPQLNARIGRDGRIRPLSSAEGRLIASEMIAERPEASLRDIASAAGISVATVRDVRERLRRGDHPVPQKLRFLTSQDGSGESDGRARRVAHAAVRHRREGADLHFGEHEGRPLAPVHGIGALRLSLAVCARDRPGRL